MLTFGRSACFESARHQSNDLRLPANPATIDVRSPKTPEQEAAARELRRFILSTIVDESPIEDLSTEDLEAIVRISKEEGRGLSTAQTAADILMRRDHARGRA